MKRLVMVLMVSIFLPLVAFAQCKPSDIDIIEWHVDINALGYIEIIGELQNNCDSDIGIELQVIAHDENNVLIDSKSFWPASINNILSGSTWPIKMHITNNPNAEIFEIRIVRVKKWR
jgi:hypothetical protein